MTKQRIILANSSRLLREMLNRILRKTDSLKVVRRSPIRRSFQTPYNRMTRVVDHVTAGG
jgi:hypothetical protein